MTQRGVTKARPGGRPPGGPVRRRRRRGVRRLPVILRGLAALLTLVALLAGLPLLLYRLGGWPIPRQLPSLHQVGQALERRDNGTLFLATVRDITWLAWAAFLIAVATEVQAVVRGSAAPRLRLGGLQALAARLVVLAMLGVSGPAALVTLTQAVPAAQAATVRPLVTTSFAPAAQAVGDTAPAAHEPAAPEPAVSRPVALEPASQYAASQYVAGQPRTSAQVMSMSEFHLVTVRSGDCLWTIAQHYLGDGDLYTEIAHLNMGRDMGGVVFSDPSVILPGWVLRVPAAGSAGPVPGTTNHPPASHGGSQSHGSHAPGGRAGHGGTHTGQGSQQPGGSGPGSHGPHPSQQPRFRRSHPAATPGPAASGANGGPAAARHITTIEPASSTAEFPPVAVFAAGMLAGGAAVGLARMRNRQRQVRRPGRRIPLPAAAPVIATEQRMRADAGLIPANWLRAALSELGAGLAETGQQVPEIAAIRILPQLMDILLASPASEPPPPPFTVPAGRQGLTWRLVIPAEAPELPTVASADGDLAPGLVTIGVADGGYLLVDLEYLGVTMADGPPALVDQVLNTAAAELATSELAGWYDLILVGFPELRQVGSRTTCCDDLDAALDLAAAKAVTLRRRLGDAGPSAVRRLRVSDPGDEDWALTLLVSRIAPSPAELALLTDLVSGPGGTAALLAAGDAPARSPGTADLEIDYEPGEKGGLVARIMPLNLQASPRPLTESDYRALTSLFAIAAQDGDVAPDEPPYDGSWSPALMDLAPDELAAPSLAADLNETMLDSTILDDIDTDIGTPAWLDPDRTGSPAWRDPDVAGSPAWRDPDLADSPVWPDPDLADSPAWRDPDLARAPVSPIADLADSPAWWTEPEPEPEPASVPDASWRRASEPEEPEVPEPAVVDAAASLRIGILGTLTVNGQPGALLPAQSQLIVALALHGKDGLSNRQLCYLLGADPDHPRPPDSLRQLIVRTRRQLGPVADGREWIEHLGSGQYALHPSTRVDWYEFEAMTSQGIAAKDPALLSDALRMIRGQPFTACHYWWLDIALVETVRAQIVDSAELLADLELADRDPAAAARAARIGLAADSAAEQLWRALMRAEHAAGNLTGVREAWTHCLEVIAEIAADGQPHPDTASLYRDLLGGSSTRFTGSWPADR